MAIDKRLKNVQQADLTESRVNDDFVYWLKTYGSNVLLVALLIAAAVMGYFWWQQRKEQQRDDAWAELTSASLPTALMEVAQKHQGKDAVAEFAQLQAADRYVGAVISGVRFDRDATASDAAVTPELRAEWLREADRLYENVAASTAKGANMGAKGFYLTALFGRAAVAEDRHDVKAAEGFLKQIQDAVKDTDYAPLGDVAAKRIASLQSMTKDIVFPSRPEMPAAGTAVPTSGGGLPPSLSARPQGGAGAGAPAGTAPAGSGAAGGPTGEDIVRQLQGGGTSSGTPGSAPGNAPGSAPGSQPAAPPAAPPAPAPGNSPAPTTP
ncbi:MAG: hypothetical protein U0636_01090 [Phycisphaerales bacterium]